MAPAAGIPNSVGVGVGGWLKSNDFSYRDCGACCWHSRFGGGVILKRMMLSRRQLLKQSALGFGSLALSSLLADEARGFDPQSPRLPPSTPRAKRVIFLFMKGGPSHVDTFDRKPMLDRDDGKPYPVRSAARHLRADRQTARSPWKFKQVWPERHRGQRAVSECRAMRRRPVLHPLDARHQSGPRRRGAQAAHRQRQVRPPQHGLVDHLRAGHREPEPAGLHHHLPDAGSWRRQQLGGGVPARGLSGRAARQCRRSRRTGHA